MADSATRFADRGRDLVHTGTTDIDISAADYTSAQVLLTIDPASNESLRDCKVTFDLAKATTGFAAGHTSETIQFLVARKVDGTNWRLDLASATTAVAGSASSARAQSIDLGTVTPTEGARVYVILSAEAADTELPYVCTYRAKAAATFTDVAAG